MMSAVSDFVVRVADVDDFASVGALRWRWDEENDVVPAVSREEFLDRFVEWAGKNRSHRCLVAVRDSDFIGMAWLAIVPRVPVPGALDRVSGDLQSVYVIPEERGNGVGAALVRAALDCGWSRGMGRITVHSGSRAIPFYEREGFTQSPHLLQIEH